MKSLQPWFVFYCWPGRLDWPWFHANRQINRLNRTIYPSPKKGPYHFIWLEATRYRSTLKWQIPTSKLPMDWCIANRCRNLPECCSFLIKMNPGRSGWKILIYLLTWSLLDLTCKSPISSPMRWHWEKPVFLLSTRYNMLLRFQPASAIETRSPPVTGLVLVFFSGNRSSFTFFLITSPIRWYLSGNTLSIYLLTTYWPWVPLVSIQFRPPGPGKDFKHGMDNPLNDKEYRNQDEKITGNCS